MLVFEESMKTGIRDIDFQHMMLYEAVNSLAGVEPDCPDDKGLWFTINDIQEYATRHFETEEEFMRKCNYPLIKEHAKEHECFIARYSSLKNIIQKENLTGEDVSKLHSFLQEWVSVHYTDNDRHLIEFLRKQQLS